MRRALAIALTAVLAGTVLSSSAAEPRQRATAAPRWLQYRVGSQRAGFNQNETQITPANLVNLQLTHIAGFLFDGPAPPVVYRNTMYTSARSLVDGDRGVTDSIIYALDAATGKRRWTYGPAPCRTVSGAPAISIQAHVLIAPLAQACSETGGGSLVALDLAMHSERWVWGYTVPGTPAVVRDTAFVSFWDPGFVGIASIDARDGSENWSLSGSFGNPAVGGGIVYVREGAALTALDAATGARLWSRSGVTGNPSVSGGRVYVPCTLGICAYDSAGAFKWGFDGYGQVTLANGRAYVGCEDTHLCAIDARTGALLWSIDAQARVLSSVVAGPLVYAQTANFVRPVNAVTGEWFDSFGSGVTSGAPGGEVNTPVVVNGRVYLVSQNRIQIYELVT